VFRVRVVVVELQVMQPVNLKMIVAVGRHGDLDSTASGTPSAIPARIDIRACTCPRSSFKVCDENFTVFYQLVSQTMAVLQSYGTTVLENTMELRSSCTIILIYWAD
jgi:hypothetical protein